ncbi:MAG TPA: hypothetical protein VHD61_09380 [Lacunisphaera sp.]|nr:hypothetical protein [Lacunisphaera sp.]
MTSRSLASAPKMLRALLGFITLVGTFALVATPAHATTVIPPKFDELVSKSDYIVRAVVTNVSAEIIGTGSSRHITTKITIQVRQVINGTAPSTVVLEQLGGQVGAERMVVDGVPTFQVGDEDILFVHGNGKNFSPLVALMHGRYPILKDTTGREYVARANGAPLYSEQDVSQPFAAPKSGALAEHAAPALSPEDFVSRIQNSVKSAATRSSLQN